MGGPSCEVRLMCRPCKATNGKSVTRMEMGMGTIETIGNNMPTVVPAHQNRWNKVVSV